MENGRESSKSASRRHCPPGKPVSASQLGRRVKRKIALARTALPHVIDGRAQLAKRYKEIAGQLIEDQGGGDLPEVRLQLIRRFAGACVLAEEVETRMMLGQEIRLEEYATLIGSTVRVANKLGLDRIARVVTPSLRDYLDGRVAAEETDCEDGEEVE